MGQRVGKGDGQGRTGTQTDGQVSETVTRQPGIRSPPELTQTHETSPLPKPGHGYCAVFTNSSKTRFSKGAVAKTRAEIPSVLIITLPLKMKTVCKGGFLLRAIKPPSPHETESTAQSRHADRPFFCAGAKKILSKTVPTASSKLFLQLLQKPAYFFPNLSDKILPLASPNWLSTTPGLTLGAQAAV